MNWMATASREHLKAAVELAERMLVRHRPPAGSLAYDAWKLDIARLRSGQFGEWKKVRARIVDSGGHVCEVDLTPTQLSVLKLIADKDEEEK